MSLMSVYKSIFRRINFANEKYFNLGQRLLSRVTVAKKQEVVEKGEEKPFSQLSEYRFVYPEFLPDPKFEFRNRVRERLEREDMLKRRSVIEIPEFYVGSVLAVTASDPYALGKENRFVGICIARTYFGLRATFTLRNVVDRQGVEVLYDLYNPSLLSVEVLRLEKRLDDHLYYLRDAPPEHSTFPFDMEPEFLVKGEPVRLNTLKVKLKPPPWHAKWEQRNLKGVEELEGVPRWRQRIARKITTPWERFDLMKEYRCSVPEEDQREIWRQVDEHGSQFPTKRQTWKRALQKARPKKQLS